MGMSLKTKVSIFITATVVVISAVSTYLYITALSRSMEKGLIERGSALSYALSKAAEEGLVNEDLDLIKKASRVIRAPDVTFAQVFSDIWETVEAYPFEKLKAPPRPEAVDHFRRESTPFSIRASNGYDFYSPIFFSTSKNTPPTVIGFARIELSSAAMQKEIRTVLATNIVVSAFITLIAIVSINVLISRFVIKPIMALYRSVSLFKNGVLPDFSGVPRSTGEIAELSEEFGRMCRTIKEKETGLIESERRIKALFERVEHAIFRLDDKGEIMDANGRFRNMFGNVNWLCEIVPGNEKASDCLQRANLERDVHREEKALGRNGEELTIWLSLYKETDERGEIKGYDGYIIDITEKKRMEERLLRSQKLEAVGTLAGGIAHDFNNLLTAIIGYSEIMLDSIRKEDPLHKQAEIIHSAAERGAELTGRILAVTRKEKTELKLVDMNEVIRSSLELLGRSIPKTIEIVTNLVAGLPKIKADPSQMQQVILNLAVNARDAMAGGGRLTIETRADGVESGIAEKDLSGRSSFINVSVSDTGMGMDKEMQGKIFDPFFTTKEMGKGTGLGLYMVHSIVTHHGGYINLYSEPGRGTRLSVYLPVAAAVDDKPPEEGEQPGGTSTILVIDDESYIRDICSDMLSSLGYEVLVAESGSEGISIFSQKRNRISLIILDMIMPRMGGEEVFQALKEIRPDAKVLLCSGYSSNGFAGIDRLLKDGASGFIQKPFSRQNIALAIKKVLS